MIEYLYILKTDDKNYIIKKVAGKNYYINNIDECYDTQIIIWNEIKKNYTKIQKKQISKK